MSFETIRRLSLDVLRHDFRIVVLGLQTSMSCFPYRLFDRAPFLLFHFDGIKEREKDFERNVSRLHDECPLPLFWNDCPPPVRKDLVPAVVSTRLSDLT